MDVYNNVSNNLFSSEYTTNSFFFLIPNIIFFFFFGYKGGMGGFHQTLWWNSDISLFFLSFFFYREECIEFIPKCFFKAGLLSWWFKIVCLHYGERGPVQVIIIHYIKPVPCLQALLYTCMINNMKWLW